MSALEIIAVTTSLLYVYLAAKESIWCWLSAAISVTLYIYICYTAQLYPETGLQVFYLFMAGYGYWQWNKPKAETTINRWGVQQHLLYISLGIAFSIFLGQWFSKNTDAAMPMIDSFTTVFSVIATFMVTKKVLENWLYWVVIDAVSIYLYYQRDLQLTAGLFAVYTVFAIYGYYKWKKELAHQ